MKNTYPDYQVNIYHDIYNARLPLTDLMGIDNEINNNTF